MVINIAFTIIILVLAFFDIKTTNTPNHRDFKSIIMTLGVLGTFIGVFIGLFDFDISNIETSIPSLLNGLKIAFYTSIVGMGVAVLISIYQRSIGFKVESKDNLDFITIQTKKLDKLDELTKISSANLDSKILLQELKELLGNVLKTNEKVFSQIAESNEKSNTHLKEYNDNFTTLLDSNKNLNEEIQKVLNSISKDMIKQLENLNHSTIKEIEKLSNDFSSDVICATNNLSSEFTNNINLHFSQNFKRFNKSVDNLLEWQIEHKKNILDSNEILNNSLKSIKTIDKAVNSIVSREEHTIELYKEVASIMKEYKSQNILLDEKLQSMRDLGNGAIHALKFMNTFFNDLNNYIKTTNENLIKNTKNTIDSLFTATIKDFDSLNKNIIDDIKNRDELLLKSIETSSEKIQNISDLMLNNNKILFQSYEKLNRDLELNAKAITQNTSEMISDINKDGIKYLKNTIKLYFDDISDTQHNILSNMSNQITKNQEMLDSTLLNLINKYLESLDKITLSSIEASKEVNLSSIQDIKHLNNEISSYIKENALSLNKSNLELLNVLEMLQKQVEISMDKTEMMQNNAKNSIKDIEESLLKTSEGFKNDYEWFLRRIKDIIGQRL